MKRFLACVVGALALATGALAAAPPLATISAAVKGVYKPKAVKIVRTCKMDYQGDGYALVQVKVAGKAGLVALQFINSTGWFAMWFDGKFNKQVPTNLHAAVLKDVARLKARCLSP